MSEERQINVNQRIGDRKPFPGSRHVAEAVDDPFVTPQEIGVRLQEFVMRDFRAAGPELHHVHDVERQPSQLRQAPGKPRLGVGEWATIYRELGDLDRLGFDEFMRRGAPPYRVFARLEQKQDEILGEPVWKKQPQAEPV